MNRTKLLLLLILAATTVFLFYVTGCDKLITETVQTTIAGNPTADFTADVEVGCEPLTVQFTDASVGPHQKWLWDFGDGWTDSVADPIHTFKTGLYDVKLTIVDTLFTGDNPVFQGQDTELKKRFILVGSSVGDISADVTVGCPGLEVTFHPAESSSVADTASVDSVRWNFGDGTAQTTVRNPTHTYANTGFYDVTLTAYGPCGVHSITDSNLIHITQCPDVVFVGTPETEGCAPLVVTFHDQTDFNYSDSLGAVGLNSRLWDFGNGQTASETEKQITYDHSGKYTVKLTLTDARGAVKTDSIVDYITVWDSVSADFIAETPSSQCFSSYQQFLVGFAPTNPGTYDSLRWDFGDGTTLLDTNTAVGPLRPAHAFVNPGRYDISLKAYGHCGDTAYTIMPNFVTLAIPIQPDSVGFTVTPAAGDTSTVFAFVDTTNGIVESRAWDFGDGGVATADSTSHQYAAAGDYWVKMTVTNSCGEVVDSVQVTVLAASAP